MLLRDKPWDKNLQLMLIAAFALNLAPHLALVPLWVAVAAGVCIGWKLLYLTRGLQLPKRWLVSIASALGAFGIFASFSTIIGQEAAGALLVIATSLKLLETNRYRDAMLVVFTCYFLLMAYLLDTQTLGSTLFMVVDAGLITVLMAQIHRRERRAPTALGPVLRMLALTMPVWTLLFFIFPRFSNSFGAPKPPQAGSGFSDELDPGSVGKLTDSDEVAFRVSFHAAEAAGENIGLSPEAFYWRGAVLAHGDGLKWTRTQQPLHADAYEQPASAEFVRTTVWLEPGFQQWLFALDVPVALASSDQGLLHLVRRKSGFVYEFSSTNGSRSSYSVRSIRHPPLQILGPIERGVYSQLPESYDPRIAELAKKLRAQAESASPRRPIEALTRLTLDWFAQNGFRYSKAPGLARSASGPAQLAEFLFRRRVGFCEHYSAAFATLMRAAGVPARVVVGFQGASHNQVGDYWVVRKMDAHAWTEVWHEEPNGRGRWLRVDPTEAVAPMRIQIGGDFNRLDETAIAGLTPDEIRRRLSGGLESELRRLSLTLDVVQMKWNSFLLSYDLEYQLQVLANLGLRHAGLILLSGLILILMILFTALVVWTNSRRARDTDPLLREWRRFCALAAGAGLERRPTEGPLAFTARAGSNFPESRADFERIGAIYAELRYGTHPQPHRQPQFRELRALVRVLKTKLRNLPVPAKPA